jgi:mxaA protein
MKTMRCVAAAVLAASSCACFADPAAEAVVVQPRPFGYTVGDLVTQSVLLARGGQPFEPSALPAAGRTNAWLERRGAHVESSAAGQRWLVVEYQLVNAPRALSTIALPAWELASAAGGAGLGVPAAAITVGPLTLPAAPGQMLSLRPDRPAPAVDTAAIAQRLWLWLAALATTVTGWIAYAAWSEWRARSTLPFARALHELRGRRSGAAPEHLVLHQAFDRTAGRVLQGGTLAALFERAPHLQALRPQIERFYDESAALFFGQGLPADALSPQALCRALRRLERRHAA